MLTMLERTIAASCTVKAHAAAEAQQRSGFPTKSSGGVGETMEKRLPIAMVVNLAPALSAAGTELTYTENVSAHGACVVSSHPWRPGEIAEVTSLLDQVTMRGKVIHCRKCGDDHYTIGLSFQNCPVVWSTYLKHARQAQGPPLISRTLVRKAPA
jgi:PilZ domain